MVRIVDVREVTKPISSPIRNAYIDFTKMTTSLVAVVTDVKRDGKRVVGYGFNSNGRYGQGGLIRERFAPRLLEANPRTLANEAFDNLDPDFTVRENLLVFGRYFGLSARETRDLVAPLLEFARLERLQLQRCLGRPPRRRARD